MSRKHRHGYHALKKQIFKHPIDHCTYCGIALTFHKATVDHVRERALGGTDKRSNLRISCSPCNKKRSDWVSVWLKSMLDIVRGFKHSLALRAAWSAYLQSERDKKKRR